MVLHLHLSPAVFDYTDWTWLGKPHTCLYKTLQLTVHVRANENHEVKGTAWRAQRQNCGKAQIWPRLQKSTGISWTKTCAQDLRLGRRFTFQQDNDPKHTAKITKEWLHNNSVTVLEWPSQSPDLNPTEHLWRDLKMAVHQRLPSNLTELERICKEEWQRIPKSRCDKLVGSFPKRLIAVLNQKGASTKYWAKGLNT